MCTINSPELSAEEHQELCRDSVSTSVVFVVLEFDGIHEEYCGVRKFYEDAINLCKDKYSERKSPVSNTYTIMDYIIGENTQTLRFSGDWMIYFILKETIR